MGRGNLGLQLLKDEKPEEFEDSLIEECQLQGENKVEFLETESIEIYGNPTEIAWYKLEATRELKCAKALSSNRYVLWKNHLNQYVILQNRANLGELRGDVVYTVPYVDFNS